MYSISFSTDDRSIATAGSDGSTLIWDTTTFGRNTPEAISAEDELLKTFESFVGNESSSHYRSLWRYVLDDRLTADLAERLSHLLTSATQKPAALELDKLIKRVTTLYELRGDEDSVRQLRQFSENQYLTSEQRMAARQSLSRIRLRFPERLHQDTLSRTSGDELYHAYWLINPEAKSTRYRKLLITRGPVERLLQVRLRAPMPDVISPSTRSPLDEQAFTIDTYQDDSIWGELFHRVDSIGTLNVERSQLVLNEQTYEIQPCPIDVVCRLLENPLGTLPLHRRSHPLHGVERTAQALALLLREQLALE